MFSQALLDVHLAQNPAISRHGVIKLAQAFAQHDAYPLNGDFLPAPALLDLGQNPQLKGDCGVGKIRGVCTAKHCSTAHCAFAAKVHVVPGTPPGGETLLSPEPERDKRSRRAFAITVTFWVSRYTKQLILAVNVSAVHVSLHTVSEIVFYTPYSVLHTLSVPFKVKQSCEARQRSATS